jgi:O-acetyl-ADP-ribose deacetylase (regulator of RNase III)
MIYYFEGNLTDAPNASIVHGCNMQGKMASGAAKDVREKFPEAYDAYMRDVFRSKLGDVIYAESHGKLIGNMLTQVTYGYDGARYANVDAIRIALDSFCFQHRRKSLCIFNDDVPPIAMPKVGCGLGGLNWEQDVEPIVREISAYHRIDFHVYDNAKKEDWK